MNTPAIALIIIDMQKGMQSPSAGKRNNPQVEKNIEKLIAKWRKNGAPIVFVRHISRTPGSPFWPGQTGVEFQDNLMPLDSEYVMEKNVPDAFIHSALERWLRVRNINEVVIAGVSTNISVESTARTAGNLGFSAIVVSDGTYTYDKIDHDGCLREASVVHAMALANLDGEFARILRTEEVLKLNDGW